MSNIIGSIGNIIGNMSNKLIQCSNKDCGHKEPVSGVEYLYKGKIMVGRDEAVLCPICGHQTFLIDDK